jgi:hypothetical protein
MQHYTTLEHAAFVRNPGTHHAVLKRNSLNIA